MTSYDVLALCLLLMDSLKLILNVMFLKASRWCDRNLKSAEILSSLTIPITIWTLMQCLHCRLSSIDSLLIRYAIGISIGIFIFGPIFSKLWKNIYFELRNSTF